MSLVGPRPTSFHASTYSLWHSQRLEATPGITGLWQIGGRNQMTFDERNRLDAAYIRNMSIRQDLRIMLLTIGSIVRRSGN
jgi:lipopolysaccharide/colanic/teichoic acid biosynthesis glycosyltransferase